MNGLTEFVKALGVGRIAALAATVATLAGFFLFVILRLSEPPMAPLYGRLDVDDAASIVQRLDTLDVPYELKGDGSLILVPEDRVLRLRMSLAEEGLPLGGRTGYELFDTQDNFSTTSFVQNLNHLRALEGELARTIRSIDAVESARVHLVLPKRELFSKDTAEPSASIVIRARRGLTQSQVKAIQNLVASGVENLRPARVAVIDESGRLLASPSESDPNVAATNLLEEHTSAFETRLRTEIEEIVSRVVGPDRARVQVAAEIDFNRVTRSSESFDPDGQVVRSTQTIEENSSNQQGSKDDGITVANSLPENQETAEAGATTNRSAANRVEEVVNYEISKTTKTEILEAGRVQKLSVAVLVDGSYQTDASGQTSYLPRSPDELDKITTLVRSAIGYDETRGDQVSVVNLRFAGTPTLDELDEPQPFLGLTTRDFIRIGEIVGLIIVTLLMSLFVVRPLINRLLGFSQATGQPRIGTSSATGAPQLTGPAGAAGAPANAGAALTADGQNRPQMLLPRQSEISAMIDIAQVEGQVKESSVKKVGEIINKHPEEALAIMRNWMYQGE